MSYRIPFPTNFISLNTPTKKADNVAVPALEVDTTHTFLSNRPTARHSSFSSESSTGSISTTSPSTQAVESPTMKASVPNFLTLNSKFEAPPTSPKDAGVEKTPFLSNRA